MVGAQASGMISDSSSSLVSPTFSPDGGGCRYPDERQPRYYIAGTSTLVARAVIVIDDRIPASASEI